MGILPTLPSFTNPTFLAKQHALRVRNEKLMADMQGYHRTLRMRWQ